MVHKTEKMVSCDLTQIKTPNGAGIHKYSSSTGDWLDAYSKEVDKMDRALDKSYEESEKLQEEAEERIFQLQDEEEAERQKEEEQLYVEQMRQLEIEKTKTEVELMKKELETQRRPQVERRIVPEVVEKKPSLKQRVVSLGKKVAGVVGTALGHPEVGVVASVLPEAETTTEVKQKEELVLA